MLTTVALAAVTLGLQPVGEYSFQIAPQVGAVAVRVLPAVAVQFLQEDCPPLRGGQLHVVEPVEVVVHDEDEVAMCPEPFAERQGRRRSRRQSAAMNPSRAFTNLASRSKVPASPPEASNWVGWSVVLTLLGGALPEGSALLGKEVRAVKSKLTDHATSTGQREHER